MKEESTQHITVTSPSGEIQGRLKEHNWLFAGIPYAEPPIDHLRFKPPTAKKPFTSPYQAFKFGPAAPQVATGGMTDSAPVRWNEDCLTLNISTPACDKQDRAVLVWIHGGGYRTGQSSIPWYAGGQFNSNGDIVVVSINYRLGALGFADLSVLGSEYATSSVNGILDQLLALKWVQTNIRAFGGNPDRVTIAGESAGGFSVATLLGCPQAQGLFHQAIPQSGGAHHTLPMAAAEIVGEDFRARLGNPNALHTESLSTAQILEAQTATLAAFEGGLGSVNSTKNQGTTVAPFYPTHGNALLPQPPIDAIRAGVGAQVAVLTGSNTHETTLWGYGSVDEAKLEKIAASLGATATLESYRQALTNAVAEDLLIALTSDYMFRIPGIRLAEARSAYTTATWMYLFNWHSRAMNGALKATHALEIPFAFNNLDKPGVDAFIGPGEMPTSVATVMHAAWIRFINHGDPGWTPYALDTRSTMVFDSVSAISHDPMGLQRKSWEGLR